MPIVRLTVTNVATLPAGEYTDSLLPGFVLRVYQSGVRSFGVAVSRDGRFRRIRLGRVGRVSLGEARGRAREVIEALNLRHPLPLAPAEGDPLTVEKLVARCLSDIKVRDKTRREWQRLARVEIVPRLGGRRAAELRRADARAVLDEIRSPFVAFQVAAILSRSYSWGLDHDLVEANPCQRLAKAPPSNDRVLSTLEIAALLRAISRGRRRFPAAADATELLLLTAVRRSAVLGMRRAELDGLDSSVAARWIIPAERMKAGRQHVVPLSPAAVAIVKRRLAAVETQHLFPATDRGHESRRTDAPAGWDGKWRIWLRRRVCRALQARQRLRHEPVTPVPRWTIHGLRHTIATHLREDLDVAPDLVSLLLSHSPGGPAVSRIYDRAAKLAERRAVLEAWAEWLARLSVRIAPRPVDPGPSRTRPDSVLDR